MAEVLRIVPRTRWFAWTFKLGLFGFRPFQLILDFGYWLLAAIRPVFGCESCGTPPLWLRPFVWLRRGTRHPHATRLAHPLP